MNKYKDKKALLAYKDKLLKDISYYKKRIVEARNLKKFSHNEDDISSDSDIELCVMARDPSISELKSEEAMLKTCLQATRELTNLEVLTSEVNVLVEDPVVEGECAITEPGKWREVKAECRIDLIPFSITFYTHSGVGMFAPISYRGLNVVPLKISHEAELAMSVLPSLKRPSDAVLVLKSYAVASRSRRSTLARLADKFGGAISMEPKETGGYIIKCANLEMSWMLRNTWDPVARFHHQLIFEIDNIDESNMNTVKEACTRLSDPLLVTEERTLLLAQIMSLSQQLSEALPGSPVCSVTFNEEPEMPRDNTQRDSEVMAPPTLPKKVKENNKKSPPHTEINDSNPSNRSMEDEISNNNVNKPKIGNNPQEDPLNEVHQGTESSAGKSKSAPSDKNNARTRVKNKEDKNIANIKSNGNGNDVDTDKVIDVNKDIADQIKNTESAKNIEKSKPANKKLVKKKSRNNVDTVKTDKNQASDVYVVKENTENATTKIAPVEIKSMTSENPTKRDMEDEISNNNVNKPKVGNNPQEDPLNQVHQVTESPAGKSKSAPSDKNNARTRVKNKKDKNIANIKSNGNGNDVDTDKVIDVNKDIADQIKNTESAKNIGKSKPANKKLVKKKSRNNVDTVKTDKNQASDVYVVKENTENATTKIAPVEIKSMTGENPTKRDMEDEISNNNVNKPKIGNNPQEDPLNEVHQGTESSAGKSKSAPRNKNNARTRVKNKEDKNIANIISNGNGNDVDTDRVIDVNKDIADQIKNTESAKNIEKSKPANKKLVKKKSRNNVDTVKTDKNQASDVYVVKENTENATTKIAPVEIKSMTSENPTKRDMEDEISNNNVNKPKIGNNPQEDPLNEVHQGTESFAGKSKSAPRNKNNARTRVKNKEDKNIANIISNGNGNDVDTDKVIDVNKDIADQIKNSESAKNIGKSKPANKELVNNESKNNVYTVKTDKNQPSDVNVLKENTENATTKSAPVEIKSMTSENPTKRDMEDEISNNNVNKPKIGNNLQEDPLNEVHQGTESSAGKSKSAPSDKNNARTRVKNKEDKNIANIKSNGNGNDVDTDKVIDVNKDIADQIKNTESAKNIEKSKPANKKLVKKKSRNNVDTVKTDKNQASDVYVVKENTENATTKIAPVEIKSMTSENPTKRDMEDEISNNNVNKPKIGNNPQEDPLNQVHQVTESPAGKSKSAPSDKNNARTRVKNKEDKNIANIKSNGNGNDVDTDKVIDVNKDIADQIKNTESAKNIGKSKPANKKLVKKKSRNNVDTVKTDKNQASDVYVVKENTENATTTSAPVEIKSMTSKNPTKRDMEDEISNNNVNKPKIGNNPQEDPLNEVHQGTESSAGKSKSAPRNKNNARTRVKNKEDKNIANIISNGNGNDVDTDKVIDVNKDIADQIKNTESAKNIEKSKPANKKLVKKKSRNNVDTVKTDKNQASDVYVVKENTENATTKIAPVEIKSMTSENPTKRDMEDEIANNNVNKPKIGNNPQEDPLNEVHQGTESSAGKSKSAPRNKNNARTRVKNKEDKNIANIISNGNGNDVDTDKVIDVNKDIADQIKNSESAKNIGKSKPANKELVNNDSEINVDTVKTDKNQPSDVNVLKENTENATTKSAPVEIKSMTSENPTKRDMEDEISNNNVNKPKIGNNLQEEPLNEVHQGTESSAGKSKSAPSDKNNARTRVKNKEDKNIANIKSNGNGNDVDTDKVIDVNKDIADQIKNTESAKNIGKSKSANKKREVVKKLANDTPKVAENVSDANEVQINLPETSINNKVARSESTNNVVQKGKKTSSDINDKISKDSSQNTNKKDVKKILKTSTLSENNANIKKITTGNIVKENSAQNKKKTSKVP